MLKVPESSSLPAELKRVSSAQFKAFQQGLPSSIKDSGLWTRTIYIRRIGRVRLWPLSLLASFLFTYFLISFLRNTQALFPFSRLGIERPLNQTIDAPFLEGCQDPIRAALDHPRENAAFVVLARNKELDGVLSSMSYLERHFNQWFNYPYVFLNNEDFNSTFRSRVRNATSAEVEFGLVSKDAWGFPDWADVDDMKEAIAQQGDRAIMYGGLETYHHMCRFFSGFFFNHPALARYDWYWRVEPDVKFFCDITYDPFRYMAQKGKVYGFVIAIKELVETVPNMFRYTSAWKRKHDIGSSGMWKMMLKKEEGTKPEIGSLPIQKIPKEILQLDPIKAEDASHRSDPESMEGEAYNMCHFWSNFEIARLDFFRSPEYASFFEEMDLTGGFWRERWGDAPIHTLGAALLLEPEQVHYFRDIGYQHTDIRHCPANAPGKQLRRPPNADGSPTKHNDWDRPKINGPGCRCECPADVTEVEGKEGTCINEWAQVIGGWLDE